MYTTLDEAEEALQDATLNIGSSKLELVKILRQIQRNELYKDAINPKTEKNVSNLDEYLKINADTFKRISGMGARQIHRTLKSFAVFIETLDFPDDIFLDMGEHFTILAEAAHVDQEMFLYDMDGTSTYGGQLLGQQHLRDQARELLDAVSDVDQDWKVRDTRELVDGIMGKNTAPKPMWTVDSYTTNDPNGNTLVHITKLNWIYDNELVEFSSSHVFTQGEFDRFVEREKITVNSVGGFGS